MWVEDWQTHYGETSLRTEARVCTECYITAPPPLDRSCNQLLLLTAVVAARRLCVAGLLVEHHTLELGLEPAVARRSQTE